MLDSRHVPQRMLACAVGVLQATTNMQNMMCKLAQCAMSIDDGLACQQVVWNMQGHKIGHIDYG